MHATYYTYYDNLVLDVPLSDLAANILTVDTKLM